MYIIHMLEGAASSASYELILMNYAHSGVVYLKPNLVRRRVHVLRPSSFAGSLLDPLTQVNSAMPLRRSWPVRCTMIGQWGCGCFEPSERFPSTVWVVTRPSVNGVSGDREHVFDSLSWICTRTLGRL